MEYEAWLDDVYGRTEMGKFWDYMETLDGIQDALDVIGLVWDGADVINLFISVCRGDWERAAWSAVGTLPLAGSLIARAGRGITKTSKAIAGKVITGAANAAAGARTVVKELELTLGALGEEFKQFKKLLQDMVEDIKKTGKTIKETPFSIRLEKVSLQFADGGYVGFGGYRITINFADDVGGAAGGGRKTEKVLGGGLGGGSQTINPNEIRFSQSSVNGSAELVESMKKNGWAGDPIDIVIMPDGGYTTIDNTRVVAARQAGIDVQANVHAYSDPLPAEYIDRFTTKKGIPETWGDAISLRIGKQNSAFRNNNPFGSFDMNDIK